jgi:hypothetical protein
MLALYFLTSVPYLQLPLYLFRAVPYTKLALYFSTPWALPSGGTVYSTPLFGTLSSTNDTTNIVSSAAALSLSLSLFLPVVS